MQELRTSPSLTDPVSEDESIEDMVFSSGDEADEVMDDATFVVDESGVQNKDHAEEENKYEEDRNEGPEDEWDEYQEEYEDDDEGSEYKESDFEDNEDNPTEEESEEEFIVEHPGMTALMQRGFAHKPPPGPPYIAANYASPPRPRSPSPTLPPEPDMQTILANSTSLNRSIAKWQGPNPLSLDQPDCYRIIWNYICRNENCPLFQYEWCDPFNFCRHLEIREHGADGRHLGRRERVAMASREQVLVAPGEARPGRYIRRIDPPIPIGPIVDRWTELRARLQKEEEDARASKPVDE